MILLDFFFLKRHFSCFLSHSLPPLHLLYFIYIWFRSCFIHIFYNLWSLLSSVLSTHFLFHQYFISFLPFFISLLLPVLVFSHHLFPGLSLSLQSVMFLYSSWHLQSLWPAQFLNKSFLSFSYVMFFFLSFMWSLLCFTWAENRSRGLISWWTEAVCCRWSWNLSFALVESRGAAFRHTQRSQGIHQH